jgi:hypothetical protein
MIDAFFDWSEGGFDVGKIKHPSKVAVQGSVHVNLDMKRMPMETATFMVCGHMRQSVRGLDHELLENSHDYLS